MNDNLEDKRNFFLTMEQNFTKWVIHKQLNMEMKKAKHAHLYNGVYFCEDKCLNS